MERGTKVYRSGIFVVICSILLLSTSCSILEKSYKLSLSHEKGKHLKYGYSFDIKRIQEVRGTEREIDRKTEAVIDYGIGDVDENGNLVVTLKFDSLTMWAKNPEREYFGDTRKSIGVPVHFTLNKRGKVIKSEGLEDLPTVPELNLRGEWDLVSFFFQLPEERVKMGDTWTGEWMWEPISSSGTRKNVFQTTYQLVDEVRKNGFDCLKIKTTTKEIVSGKSRYGNREIETSGEIDLTGEIYFAYKEGILVEKSYVEEAGRLHWKVDSPQPMEIHFTNFVQAKFSLIL